MKIENRKIKLYQDEFELIDSGFCEGQFNMDFDYQRTMDVAEGKALPMFRVYGWKPWTLSLGYNQNEDDIDKSQLESKGFGLVRRPTGGRAVLHADELTYSVVTKIPENKNAQDLYKEIHVLLLEGLQTLNPKEIGFEKAQPDFRNFYKNEPGLSVSCFASSARYEIEFQGRKVVGSAQRVFGNTLLQHGSIILAEGHEQLAEISKISNYGKKVKLKEYILSHSTSLKEACEREISYEECAEALLNVFKK